MYHNGAGTGRHWVRFMKSVQWMVDVMPDGHFDSLQRLTLLAHISQKANYPLLLQANTSTQLARQIITPFE